MIIGDVMNSDPGRKRSKRVGRGIGSGRGKTCTRGTKGAGARTGSGGRLTAEGGQMQLFRRLPHRGFNNTRFRGVAISTVNVNQLNDAFQAGETVDLKSLQAKGLAKKNARLIKVLGHGELTKKLIVQVHAVSDSARAKIEAASGSIEQTKK